jgi:hypothetical protein
MSEAREKIPGDRVRYVPAGGTEIEDDWQLVRFEPETGNAVLERAGARVSVGRDNFLRYNFPGSDDVYFALRRIAPRDEAAATALGSWANNDLAAVRRSLKDLIARSAPAFAGIQTVSDLAKKLVEREETVDRALAILKLDIARAEREYARFSGRTALENDEKDNLLLRLRNFEDQYATKLFEKTNLIPAWQEMFRALSALEEKLK